MVIGMGFIVKFTVGLGLVSLGFKQLTYSDKYIGSDGYFAAVLSLALVIPGSYLLWQIFSG